MRSVRSIAKAVLPWLIAASVVAILLSKYSADEIAAQMKRGNVLAMIPCALLGPIAYLALIALADRTILRAIQPGITYYDVLRGRAATSTLGALNYAAGGAAYGVWLAFRTASSAKTTAGTLLFIMLSDLTGVCTVAAGAMLLSTLGEQPALQTIALVIIAVQLSAIAIGPRLGLEHRAAATAWAKTPRQLAFAQIGVRCLAIACSTLALYAGARAFGLPLPFGWAAIHIPITLLVQSMPVNIAGIGAAQGVWLLAFERYAPGEQILAFQILWQLANSAALVLRGLPFLRRTLDEIKSRGP